MELLTIVVSVLGSNGLLLFLVKRFFEKRDKKEQEEREARSHKEEDWEKLLEQVKTCLETIRLLSYARMSEETEKLLNQGYATPTERRILDEMYKNYKAHGWNGDMDSRMEKVYHLRTAPPEE